MSGRIGEDLTERALIKSFVVNLKVIILTTLILKHFEMCNKIDKTMQSDKKI